MVLALVPRPLASLRVYSWVADEGGMKKKQDQHGTFENKEDAQEKCDELNRKIDIARGGFQVHAED